MSITIGRTRIGRVGNSLDASVNSDRFRHVGDEQVYRGHLWNVVIGDFEGPGGALFRRDIVRSPGAVGVVPIIGRGSAVEVVLLKQYRAPFDDHVIEIPAGMRDVSGEDPLETAQRELIEEAGLRAGRLEALHRFYPSPGMTDAILHLYLATQLEEVARDTQGVEEEHMEVFRVSLRDAVEMVVEGIISDAKSVIGLLLAERRLKNAGEFG